MESKFRQEGFNGKTKKTGEEFRKEVYNLVKDDYVFLEKYKGYETKIKVRHNVCGFEYKTTPDNFLHGYGCPKCAGNIKKTTEQFKEEVYNLVNGDYTVLGGYTGNKNKVLLRHEICDRVFKMSPNSFLRGQRCPWCSGKMRKTTKRFKEEVRQKFGDGYEVISQYKNANTKVKIRHNCGYEWECRPTDFLKSKGCVKCRKEKQLKDDAYKFEKYVSETTSGEYSVLSEYLGATKPIKVKHNKCGHEYTTTPYFFRKRIGCEKCSGTLKLTTARFKEEVFKQVGNEYSVLGEYKNTRTKIKMRHNKCGHVWHVTPNRFLSKTRCPRCKASKGEEAILNYLKDLSITFETQKTFEGLSYKNSLFIDFYLPEHNIAIEYDGLHHFKPVDFSGKNKKQAKKNFDDTKKRDKIKEEYCKKNRIKLIRIPYTEFDNIENILSKEIINSEKPISIGVLEQLKLFEQEPKVLKVCVS